MPTPPGPPEECLALLAVLDEDDTTAARALVGIGADRRRDLALAARHLAWMIESRPRLHRQRTGELDAVPPPQELVHTRPMPRIVRDAPPS